MVGGNFVVGAVIFLIITLVQFIVITKGAERVAEVAARFTLDAMPGKQMSIDAELAAGFITEQQARARKKHVEQEADFYGAMDGASKFVRGDAIAALIMIAINLVGGLLIGVIQNGLDIQSAVSRYSLLTVGDGLVSQIPAMLVSTATGILVTRSSSTGATLGGDVLRQLFGNPRALLIASGLLAALGVAWWYMRKTKLPPLATADVFAPGLALGHGIGRVGCFMAGCCWGVQCDRPWAELRSEQSRAWYSRSGDDLQRNPRA